jgi:hypothetical protein
MLYDLDAHRRKGVLLALCLDHNVGLSAANDAEQRLPVPAVHTYLKPWSTKQATKTKPRPECRGNTLCVAVALTNLPGRK